MVRSSIAFVGLLVDIATKFETTGVGTDEEGNTRGWSTFQKPNNVFHATSICSFQLVMAWRVYSYMALGGNEGAVIMEIILVLSQ